MAKYEIISFQRNQLRHICKNIETNEEIRVDLHVSGELENLDHLNDEECFAHYENIVGKIVEIDYLYPYEFFFS